GGRFNWASAGDSSLFAELADFAFKTSAPQLRAEKAVMHDSRLTTPVTGAFEFKSVRRPAGRPSSGFPRFISYGNEAVFSGFNENIAYKGGYYLQGHELFSSSLSGKPSEIVVSFQGKPAFRSTSQRFSLSP